MDIYLIYPVQNLSLSTEVHGHFTLCWRQFTICQLTPFDKNSLKKKALANKNNYHISSAHYL